jgi:hypothetical protein
MDRPPGAPKPAHLPAGIGTCDGNIPIHDWCIIEYWTDLRKKMKELRKEKKKRARKKVVVKDKVKVEKSAGTFCQARQFSKAEKLTEPEPVLIIRNVSPFPSWATLFPLSSFLSFLIRGTSPTLLSSHLSLPPSHNG